jgi:hypothetical protein
MLILEVYAVICLIVTIAFVAWGLASRRRANSDILETIKDFDQAVGDQHSDFNPQTGEVASSVRGLSGPSSSPPNSPARTRSKATGAT